MLFEWTFDAKSMSLNWQPKLGLDIQVDGVGKSPLSITSSLLLSPKQKISFHNFKKKDFHSASFPKTSPFFVILGHESVKSMKTKFCQKHNSRHLGVSLQLELCCLSVAHHAKSVRLLDESSIASITRIMAFMGLSL